MGYLMPKFTAKKPASISPESHKSPYPSTRRIKYSHPPGRKRVQGLGFREKVQVLGFGVWGLGFRV